MLVLMNLNECVELLILIRTKAFYEKLNVYSLPKQLDIVINAQKLGFRVSEKR